MKFIIQRGVMGKIAFKKFAKLTITLLWDSKAMAFKKATRIGVHNENRMLARI